MKKIIFALCFCMGLSSLLVAQPDRKWSTYFGTYNPGLGTQVSSSVYDPVSRCLYVAGTTTDTSGIASPGSFQPLYQPSMPNNTNYDRQIFLAKFDTSGHRVWSTYIGSDAAIDEYPKICADHFGNIILAGRTKSVTNIATPGGFSTYSNGRYQPFMMKFSGNGQRIWGTYLFVTPASLVGGGALYNGSNIGLAVDTQNNIYISTATMDTAGIATPDVFQPYMLDTNSLFSKVDGCLMKFDPNGAKVWGSYYGGENAEDITALCIGDDNHIYGAGFTLSLTAIATPGAEVPVNPVPVNGGGFMFKFTLSGQRVWGTYISGNEGMHITGILAKNNELFLSGGTGSTTGIATAGSHQTALDGVGDAMLMKFTTAGTKVWGTYYGGSGGESFNNLNGNLAMDNEDHLYMAGVTTSPDKIKKGCTYNAFYNDSYVSKWNRDGALLWGSYCDGTLNAFAAVPGNNSFFVSGHTSHDSLTTPGAHQPAKTLTMPSGFITMFRGDFVCPVLDVDITLQGRELSIGNDYQSYQWYYNGNPVNGATASTYSSSDTGSYYVVFTQCDCTYTSDTFHYTGPLDITDVQGGHTTFVAYPNPGKGTYTLQYTGMLPEREWKYAVADISGHVLTQGVMALTSGNRPVIDLTRLDNGIYFVRLSGKNGHTILKLVKSK